MAFWPAALPDLTINSGSSASGTLIQFEDAYGLSIQAPPTLTSTAIFVQGVNSTSATQPFATIQSGGVDITFEAAKMIILTPIPVRQIRLMGSAVEGATRTFTVAKVFPG